jgi:hypothetical protein
MYDIIIKIYYKKRKNFSAEIVGFLFLIWNYTSMYKYMHKIDDVPSLAKEG